MPTTMTMPKLSPTMEEGTIAKWHKKVGEFVEPGDVLFEVSTDKATVEHSALDAGWLRKIIVTEGKKAKVNQPIAIFTEEKEESIEGYKPPEAIVEKPQKKEKVEKETPAATPTQQAVPRGQPSFVPEPPLNQYTFTSPTETSAKRLKASPLARKLAKEKGLDISTVKGSGPGERIVSRDLEQAQAEGKVTFGKRQAPQSAPGTFEEEELSPMRQVIAQRLQDSKSFIPHFYVQQAIDAQPLKDIREQLSTFGTKVSINDLIIRGTALALKEHPNVNSGFNSVNQTLVRFKTIDVAVAVSLPEGLITPIIRHADFKNVGEISVEMRALAKKAKEGKLDPQEYKGGSFTISNLGMYGITDFQAIINPPQAAILAISSILDLPVVKNGTVVPGKVLNLTLSADHRVVDGVAAAQFLKTLQKYLENPAALLVV